MPRIAADGRKANIGCFPHSWYLLAIYRSLFWKIQVVQYSHGFHNGQAV